MKPDFDHIAERIRAVLADLGMSQRELARRAGLAPTQVGVILNRLPSMPYAIELETLSRIAQGAHVSLFWLVTGCAEAEVDAPPPLRFIAGWVEALAGAQRIAPNVRPWVWEWVGDFRLRLDALLVPTPALLLDLAQVVARQSGYDKAFEAAPEPYRVPPIATRPKKTSSARVPAKRPKSAASAPKPRRRG